MPAMPADSVSEDSPAVAALEAEIVALLQLKRARPHSGTGLFCRQARPKASQWLARIFYRALSTCCSTN
jgi:hypothetical protein